MKRSWLAGVVMAALACSTDVARADPATQTVTTAFGCVVLATGQIVQCPTSSVSASLLGNLSALVAGVLKTQGVIGPAGPQGPVGPAGAPGSSQITFGTTTGTVADGGALAGEVSARQTEAALMLPISQLASRAFQATNGAALRSMADRASDRLNLNEFFLAGDPDDTQSVVRMYAKATALMNAGKSVVMDFPRLIRVSTMPQLQVPRGAQPVASSAPDGGTEIVVTGASNGFDWQVVAPSQVVAATYPNTAFTRFGIGDFQVTKASTAPAGYDAFRFAGLPNSSGGGLSALTAGRLIAAGYGFGGNTANPWTNATHLVDQNYYRVGGSVFTATGAPNGEVASGTGFLIETTQSSSSNFSVDGEIGEVIMNGGFAGIATKGHVEGLHALSGTIYNTAYGIYSPAWLVSGSGANAVYTGTFGLYLTQFHLANTLRGVYCEYCKNFQMDASSYIRGMGSSAAFTPPADAVLPADTTDVHPNDGSANQGYSYVAVDLPDSVFSNVVGVPMDAENSLYSYGIRNVSKSIYGETAPQYLNGLNFQDNPIFAFSISAFVSDDTAVRSSFDNNNSIGNPNPPTFGKYVEHHGNQHNGAPLEDGCQGGTCVHNLPEQFNSSITSPYGAVALGGTYHGLLDWKLQGSSAPTTDCRQEVFLAAGATSNPTSDYQGMMNFSCAGGIRSSGPFVGNGGYQMAEGQKMTYGTSCAWFHDVTITPNALVFQCGSTRLLRLPDDGSAPIVRTAPVVGSP